MVRYFLEQRLFKTIIAAVLAAFATTSVGPLDMAHAQTLINLPAPGAMIRLSPTFKPLQIKGIEVSSRNPLHFDFLVDKGDSKLFGQPLKDEITRLSKYFLTCLTVPETDLWVNLSPYEKDRIAASGFGVTQMGKDLLEQDYLLKQITASSSYPESRLGQQFWRKVFEKAYALYGTTNVPASTFNKIWIVPQTAQVYARGNSAFVVDSKLDVMMEADYLALTKQGDAKVPVAQYSKAYTDVFRSVILPELRREVNEGKNFAVVRQVYDAMILATWYKRHLKDSVLGRAYVGKNKIQGVDVPDRTVKERIFRRYLESFKKQVYNYIKEDYDPHTQQMVPRKYVAGGVDFAAFGVQGSKVYRENSLVRPVLGEDLAMAAIDLSPAGAGRRMPDFLDARTFPQDHPFKQYSSRPALAAAMLPRVRRFAAAVAAVLAVGVAGMVVPGPVAHAATFVRGENGTVIVALEPGDKKITPGHLVLQMQEAYRQVDPVGLAGSDFGGNLWGPKGTGAVAKVFGVADVSAIKLAPRMIIHKPYPDAALQRLTPSAVSSASAVAASKISPEPNKPIPASPGSAYAGGNAHAGEPPSPAAQPALGLGSPARTATGSPVSVSSTVDAADPVEHLNAIRARLAGNLQAVSPPAGPGLILPPTFAERSAQPAANDAILSRLRGLEPAGGAAVSQAVPVVSKRLEQDNEGSLSGAELALIFGVVLAVRGIGKMFRWKKSSQRKREGAAPLAARATGEVRSIRVVTGGPVQPDAEELRAARSGGMGENTALDPSLETRLAALRQKAAPGYTFRVPPRRDWISGPLAWAIGLAAAYGTDPDVLPAAAVALPFVTPLLYTAQIWLHEFLGHILPAYLVYAGKRKGILHARNLMGNWSVREWWNSLVPFGSVPSRNPRVYVGTVPKLAFQQAEPRDGLQVVRELLVGEILEEVGPDRVRLKYPAIPRPEQLQDSIYNDLWERLQVPTGWRHTVVRLSGLVASVLVGVGVAWGGVMAVMDHLWLAPLVGPVAVSIWSSLRGAWGGDGPAGSSSPGKYDCGNFLVFWNGMNGNPDWVRNGLDNMLRTLTWRGGQSAGELSLNAHDITWEAGQVAMSDAGDGKVDVNLVKVMKAKRGPGNDLIGNLLGNFQKGMKRMRSTAIKVYGVNGHVRYATGGAVTRLASHPHLSSMLRKVIWAIKDGKLAAGLRDVIVAITHNGDNDEYLLHGTKLNLDQMRAFFVRLVHFRGVLPPGDSPVIALQILFHLTQGNWDASVRYAHIMGNHETALRAMEDVLSEAEEGAIGGVFEKVWSSYATRLLRMERATGIQKFQDMYVTKEQAAENAVFRRQYGLLERFKQDLMAQMQTEIDKKTAAGRIMEPWHQSPERRRKFVDIAVEKFFTGDRDTAVHEFTQRASGTYGLVVRTSLRGDSNNDETTDGVTIFSRAQGMAFGWQLRPEQGFFAAASDPLVLLNDFGDRGKLDSMVILNPAGKGEMVDINLTRSGSLSVRLRDLNGDREVKDIARREYLLDESNPFYESLIQYDDPRQMVDQDIRSMADELAKARANWKNPSSFSRRSANAMLQMLLGKYVEKYIKSKSALYAAASAIIDGRLRELRENCAAGGSCSGEQRAFFGAHAKDAEDVHDAIVKYVMKLLDEQIEDFSDEVASELYHNKLDSQHLYNRTVVHINENWREWVENDLVSGSLAHIAQTYRLARAHNGGHGFITAPKIDFLVTGYENSLWLGENFAAMMRTLMPALNIVAVSSNKIVQTNPQGGEYPAGYLPAAGGIVDGRTVALIVSKSGSTFPSLGQNSILGRMTPGKIFGMTGRLDSMLSLALGTELRADARFNERIFPVGNVRPAEPGSTDEVRLNVEQIELAVYLAKRLRGILPEDKPWGLKITDADVGHLDFLLDAVQKDAVRITGYDRQGAKVNSEVNTELIKAGRNFGKTIMEGGVVKAGFFAAVFAMSYLGAPVSSTLEFLGIYLGPLGTAIDATFACSLPFILTQIYRWFSGRNPWARLGAPVLVIGDQPYLHQTTEQYVTKLGSYAFGSQNVQVHGGNLEDHFGARFAHRIVRGVEIMAGIPVDAEAQKRAKVSLKQAKAMNYGAAGNFLSTGAHVVTMGTGEFNEPDATTHHINLGEKDRFGDTIPFFGKDASPLMRSLVNLSFDPLRRHMAYKVYYHRAWKTASANSRLYDIQETPPKTGVHSTRSPSDIYTDPEPDMPQPAEHPAEMADADTAMTAGRKGGVDMNSSLLDLRVTEAGPRFDAEHNVLLSAPINGMVPEVSAVVPVTSVMLERLLQGAGRN